jgi:hypothetical protein
MENLPTKPQNTQIVYWKDTNAAMVSLLVNGKFDDLAKSVPNKISELLECEPIQSLISHVGSDRVKAYLEAEIIKLALNFNGNPALNIKDYQVPVIAEQLIENYKWESVEDFTLCFRRASAGLYGEIYRIDGAVIGQWFSRYLDEKYDALEQKKAKEKHQEGKEPRINNVVDGSKYLDQILENLGVPKKEHGPREETEFQRHKLENPPIETPKENVIARLTKLRECQERAIRDKYPAASEEEIKQMIDKL